MIIRWFSYYEEKKTNEKKLKNSKFNLQLQILVQVLPLPPKLRVLIEEGCTFLMFPGSHKQKIVNNKKR